jgi:hypothetical protein
MKQPFDTRGIRLEIFKDRVDLWGRDDHGHPDFETVPLEFTKSAKLSENTQGLLFHEIHRFLKQTTGEEASHYTVFALIDYINKQCAAPDVETEPFQLDSIVADVFFRYSLATTAAVDAA